MTRKISAWVFDAYGTLFDVHSVSALAESLFPGRGAALSSAWRAKQLEYTWLRSLMGRYQDFRAVTSDSLGWALESLRLVADGAARRALLDQYRRLALFPEVPGALRALSASGPLAILSNGHPEMLDAVVDHCGLRHLFRGGVLSVHQASVYKPHPDAYRVAEAALSVPRPEVGFVSSNGWDAAGAAAFGFTVHWVNRGRAPAECLGVSPHVVVPTLAELGAV